MNQFWLWNVSATTKYDMNQKVTPLVGWLSFPIGKKKKKLHRETGTIVHTK